MFVVWWGGGMCGCGAAGGVCVCVGGVMWRGMYVGGREVAYMCRGGGAYVCAGYECGGGGGGWDEGGDGVHVRCTCFHCGV